ncbi:MAG: SemiSWEET transporter [bacterium]|jgi:MtN3 and saliva related transmembrane protein
MDAISLLGYLAGTLTTLSFLPQLLKVIKTRSTKDISLLMFIVITIGIFLWLIYGLLIASPPIIIANLVTLAIASMILYFKLKYK